MGAAIERGDLTGDDPDLAQRAACPTGGACQVMGSAATGQGAVRGARAGAGGIGAGRRSP